MRSVWSPAELVVSHRWWCRWRPGEPGRCRPWRRSVRRASLFFTRPPDDLSHPQRATPMPPRDALVVRRRFMALADIAYSGRHPIQAHAHAVIQELNEADVSFDKWYTRVRTTLQGLRRCISGFWLGGRPQTAGTTHRRRGRRVGASRRRARSPGRDDPSDPSDLVPARVAQ